MSYLKNNSTIVLQVELNFLKEEYQMYLQKINTSEVKELSVLRKLKRLNMVIVKLEKKLEIIQRREQKENSVYIKEYKDNKKLINKNT